MEKTSLEKAIGWRMDKQAGIFSEIGTAISHPKDFVTGANPEFDLKRTMGTGKDIFTSLPREVQLAALGSIIGGIGGGVGGRYLGAKALGKPGDSDLTSAGKQTGAGLAGAASGAGVGAGAGALAGLLSRLVV